MLRVSELTVGHFGIATRTSTRLPAWPRGPVSMDVAMGDQHLSWQRDLELPISPVFPRRKIGSALV
jgi:hypothetical protein